MDRIKKLSNDVMAEYKADFGVDFSDNKKALDKISTIRSKGLKNEIAGFITKFIKREIREQKEKEERERQFQKQIADEKSRKDASLQGDTAAETAPLDSESSSQITSDEAAPEQPAAEPTETAPASEPDVASDEKASN